MMVCSWPASPGDLTLPVGEVHIWCAWLNPTRLEIQELQGTLTQDELERAQRYRFERDRRRFVVRRGLLRIVLGRYQGVSPGNLRFIYNDYGKPSLAPAFEGAGLRFNLSHSDELSLFAFTCQRDVGVDVERIRADLEHDQIAERFFSPAERSILRSLSVEVKPQAFFTCWTRKEAYLKARGEGLSQPLDQFDVSLIPGEPARLLATSPDFEETGCWTLHHLDPAPGFVAALAVEGLDHVLRCWQIKDWEHFLE